MENRNNRKYKAAKKRVEDLKGFYNHLAVYIIVNLIIIGSRITRIYSQVGGFAEINFERWLNLNTYSVALFWGIGLAIHALKTFDFKFFRSWEERKINEIMKEDDLNSTDNLKF